MRNNTISKVKNHSDFDLLPKTKVDKTTTDLKDFKNEEITIKEIDYYFSNSIARSSKTMSDCRSIRSKNLKEKTGT